MREAVLEIRRLTLRYGTHPAVNEVSLRVAGRRIVMLAGESGSGKSTLLRSVLGLNGQECRIAGGEIFFEGKRLPLENEKKMRNVRGKDIAVVPQNPDLFFNPLAAVGTLYYESLRAHRPAGKREALREAESVLSKLGFDAPRQILKMKPFELSGGMCQRVALAVAMANGPRLLLADEPTSALDVAAQQDVMALLKSIRDRYGTAILMATHNLSLAARHADEIGILYRGRLVEWGSGREVLQDPRNGYTKMLLKAVPRLGGPLPETAERSDMVFGADAAARRVGESHWYLDEGKG